MPVTLTVTRGKWSIFWKEMSPLGECWLSCLVRNVMVANYQKNLLVSTCSTAWLGDGCGHLLAFSHGRAIESYKLKIIFIFSKLYFGLFKIHANNKAIKIVICWMCMVEWNICIFYQKKKKKTLKKLKVVNYKKVKKWGLKTVTNRFFSVLGNMI